MKSKSMLMIVIVMVVLAILGGRAISAQDKYSLQVPGGLAFSEFRGYEKWQVVSVSEDLGLLAALWCSNGLGHGVLLLSSLGLFGLCVAA